MVSIPIKHTDRAYVNSPPPDRVGHFSSESSDDEDEFKAITSSSSIDDIASDLNTVEVIFNKIYLDPLQEVLESIDAEAASILRTGKLTVLGEAGDMNIVQPILFSLQATEAELPVLLPQLLQSPFFNQKEENFTAAIADNLLHHGCIRLGIMVDQVIYKLLSTHCCKGPGSRQADMLIETALKTSYNLPTAMQRFQANFKNPPPLFLSGYPSFTLETIQDTYVSDEEENESVVFNTNLDVPNIAVPKTSASSGFVSKTSSSSIKQSIAEEDIISRTPPPFQQRIRAASVRYGRKDSIFSPPSNGSFGSYERRESDDSIDEVSSTSSLRVLDSGGLWHATLPFPGDMIVGSFGESSYPILIWNPELKVTFKLGTTHVVSSSTLVVDNPKEILKLKVVNTTDLKIAFSIRSHRQSMLFRSHVVFPKAGLHLLEPQQEWTAEAEFMRAGEYDQDEHICIDLLVCQLNCTPSWNVHRRYAVLKQGQDQHKIIKKLSRSEHIILPGNFASQKDLGHYLKQLILHGLQCVVKNKLDQAEVIFSQALLLPIFQRVPLKAFAYICLAVTANKRRKKGEQMNKVSSVLKLVNSMDKLVEACESAPSMRMPKMIGLIKQLKKELNPAKVIKDQRQTLIKKQVSTRNETTKEVYPTGDALDLYNISLMIPGGALPQPANITLSHLNQDEIHQSIQSSVWSSMLNIIAAISIQCSPPIERFDKPVVATIILPIETSYSTPLRLLQSNYMSTWIDITDDPHTEVTLENGRLTLRTDNIGWLIVASLQFDITKIMPIAIKSVFSEELISMDVNAYGYIFPDSMHAQVSVFITPHKDNPRSQTPPGHRQIAFPHTFKAYKNQKVRIVLQGKFEPDTEAGQTSLQADLNVDGDMMDIVEKTVKLLPESKGLYGKLTLSTFCTVHKIWEKIQDINLSSPTAAHDQTEL